MSRRHIDDQALDLSFCDLLKLLSHHLMVAPINEARPHLFDKRRKVTLGLLPLQAVLIVCQLNKESLLLVDWQPRYLLSDRVDVHIVFRPAFLVWRQTQPQSASKHKHAAPSTSVS